MTNDQKIFLRLMACAIGDVALTEKFNIENSVTELAKAHRCESMAYVGALKCGVVPPDSWKYNAFYGAINNEKKLAVQDRVIKQLEEASIKYAVLKGTSVARCYPTNGLRVLGDIDILVDESDYEKAVRIFLPDADMEDYYHDFHYVINIDGVSVEIHKYLTHKSDDNHGKKIFELLSDALAQTVDSDFEGHSFRMLKPKYQALSLLLHKWRHMNSNGFAIRMLCDWISFVSSLSRVEWETEIYPFIKEAGLHLYADALNMCACRYFGVDVSDKVFRKVGDETIKFLMDILLAGGAAGAKNVMTSSIGSIYEKNLRNSGKLVAVFKSINEIARHQFKIARYPIFLPFFWMYIPGRYIFRTMIGKREMVNISQFGDIVHKRNKVYRQLSLDR